MRIYKYPIGPRAISDHVAIEMPKGARVICVQVQREVPCLWASVNPDEKMTEARHFRIVGTGHDYEAGAMSRYVGTFQLEGGALVFHLFEEA
jgi:hypothetical protein